MDPHTGAVGHRREHDSGELPVENAVAEAKSFFVAFVSVMGFLSRRGEFPGRDGSSQFLAAYLVHRCKDFAARAVDRDRVQPVPFRCGGPQSLAMRQ